MAEASDAARTHRLTSIMREMIEVIGTVSCYVKQTNSCKTRAEEEASGFEINTQYSICKSLLVKNTMVRHKLPTFSLSFRTRDTITNLSELINNLTLNILLINL